MLIFSYSDVGSRGVGRWLRLSRKFERGLSPLVGLLELENASLEAHLAQIGISFEMLGYDLLLESGASRKGAKEAKFAGQVRAVSSAVAEVLPFSADEFPDLLRRTYVGVKHADNARPERQEVYLAYWQSIQVFRTWVALRLGVPEAQLKTALEYDAVTRRIQDAERDLRS